ncbi:hypothetical protein CEXT_155401 [Caerostris extrusa]|uniref:Uncharacterized protein n=1 Tax=Caerostris extrusa TaxID=172846 RepID=A0AAV4WZM3_CAEEX|nr:hypothetical protein CEXT_155401 [Caerostris extrusa]
MKAFDSSIQAPISSQHKTLSSGCLGYFLLFRDKHGGMENYKTSGMTVLVRNTRFCNSSHPIKKAMYMIYFLMVICTASAHMADHFKSPFSSQNGDDPVPLFPESVSDFESQDDAAQHHFLTGGVSRYMKTDRPHHTPPPCHVEVQVDQRVPGHCIRMAGNTPACQTNEYLYPFNMECLGMF